MSCLLPFVFFISDIFKIENFYYNFFCFLLFIGVDNSRTIFEDFRILNTFLMSKKPPYPINNKYPPYDLGDYDIQMSTGGATPSSPQVVSPSAQATDSETQFLIAYECAKVNREWDKVRTALMEHPDWLTRVPTGLYGRVFK